MKKLDLRGTAVDDDAMAYLKDLEKLIVLDLSESIVGNGGLEHLKSVEQLEELNLWAARVGDEGMQHVGELTNLTHLNLDNVGFPSTNMPVESRAWMRSWPCGAGSATTHGAATCTPPRSAS